MTKRKPKDDGVRHGRMVGKHPALGMPYGAQIPREAVIGEVHGDLLIDPEKMPKPIQQQVLEAAMAKFPGRMLEYVDLPDGGVGLRPYQREMLSHIMDAVPFTTPVEGDTYEAFAGRYTKTGSPTGRFSARAADYIRQGAHSFSEAAKVYTATGDADAMMARFRDRRFYAHRGNHIDDVFDRKRRRAEAKLREYCRADVLIFNDYAAIELRILFTMLDGYPTAPVSHRLKAPYGHPMGTGISLTRNEPADRQTADMIGGLMVGWGCPSFIARRVADCMYASGRYDCRVTLSRAGLMNLLNAAMALQVVVTMADEKPVFEKSDSDRDTR